MTDDDLVRLQLELASHSPTPLGRLIAPDGTVRAFASWLELLTALQAAVDPQPSANALKWSP